MKLMNKGLWISVAVIGLAGATMTPATADIIHADDVIINGGSLCVGFDCVNGESFGFDTIRLKENNLRIKAQDTSNTASFPSNDWQITFNDTSNGGTSKFSIDDIDGGRTPFTIEAGASSHSLYVESGGDVGFGTNNPVVDLHAVSGNTPTLRLEQDGSSGFASQTWDLAGNETNFFIRDVTNGSTLPFRIFPGAGTNALVIDGDGEVGVGTNAPSAPFDVFYNDTFSYFRMTANTGTTRQGDLTYNGNAGEFRMNVVDGDGFELAVNADGDLKLTGDCIQIGANQCTVSGSSFTCAVGTCP